MAASTSHIRKRQYQPSNQTRLTSFFGDGSETAKRPAMSPELPPDVSASLLSVGMRVRKSVPEGYKNKALDVLAGLPFPSSAPPASSASARTTIRPMQTRELMPFCGLHKTGGWAAQDVPSSSAPATLQASRSRDADDDMPGLSMSQSTTTSQQSFGPSQTSSTSKKRTYEEESEAFIDDVFDELDDAAAETAQTSIPPRRMARMKASAQKKNTSGSVRIFGSDDFEEATFLVPLESEMDMDR